jgi:hypothetical protein
MPGLPSSRGFAGVKRGSLSAQIKIQAVLDELKKRGVENDYCQRCEKLDWNVDLVEIPANSALSATGLPTLPGAGLSGYLSLLAVVCRNCGNTIFHNLDILGISLR